jgi:hypothetical protein
MAGVIRRLLSDHMYFLALFLRAGLGMAVLIYITIWVLYPEQTATIRTYFAIIGFLVFAVAGIVESSILYRKNKSNAREHVNKDLS